MGGRDTEVISLSLSSPEEMFSLEQADLFSEYRNFMTGVEYCISVLRGHRSTGSVRLEVTLPPAAANENVGEQISRTLRRYCDHRIAHNQRERRAVRLDGASSLWVGVPIAILGFLVVITKASLVGHTGNPNLILDTGGWVLVWIGLWFPLDSILFSPLAYGRENRALRRLRVAIVDVEPHRRVVS